MAATDSTRVCLHCGRPFVPNTTRQKYCTSLCFLQRPRKTVSLAERFWAKVERNEPTACWPWTAAINDSGYGTIGRGPKSAGHDRAHRVAWQLTHGPIPEGLFVCHACDNRMCCNPRHLFLGTNAANMRDMVAKKRQYVPKLNENAVRDIRARYAAGTTQAALAAEFAVSKRTVSLITLRKRWAHVR